MTFLNLLSQQFKIILSNFFGIPNNGADICGFKGDATEELCIRWLQLGSLYPFARFHNHKNYLDQEPYAFGHRSLFLKVAQRVMSFRYSILKYFYSLFVRKKGAGTVFRALFWEFPEEILLREEVLNSQFLIGRDIMVTPVLQSNEKVIYPYFPGETTFWFDFFTGKREKGGEFSVVMCELDGPAPVFLRSGGMIFTQNVEKVRKTEDLDDNFVFACALEYNTSSLERAYYCDGEIMACSDFSEYAELKKCMEGDCFLKASLELIEGKEGFKLSIEFVGVENGAFDTIYLEEVHLYGIEEIQLRKFIVKDDVYNEGLVEEDKRIKKIKMKRPLTINNKMKYEMMES